MNGDTMSASATRPMSDPYAKAAAGWQPRPGDPVLAVIGEHKVPADYYGPVKLGIPRAGHHVIWPGCTDLSWVPAVEAVPVVEPQGLHFGARVVDGTGDMLVVLFDDETGEPYLRDPQGHELRWRDLVQPVRVVDDTAWWDETR